MDDVTEADVAELARLLEAELGWAVEAGWRATARIMLRKVAAAAEVPA